MIKATIKLKGLKDIFRREEIAFIIDSMIEGLTPAEVYVDSVEKPSIALVWNRAHCFYFGGDSVDEKEYYTAIEIFKKIILTQEIKRELGAAKIHFTSEAWGKVLLESLTEFKAALYPRTLYRHGLKDIPKSEGSGYLVKEITREILIDKEIGNIELVKKEIKGIWELEQNFLRSGFGYAAMEGENVVGWCTAEYVGKTTCGIGIETLEDYQKRGIATDLCMSFINKCKTLNITPYWDCWARNLPSVKVAEKAGFERVLTYEIAFVIFQ